MGEQPSDARVEVSSKSRRRKQVLFIIILVVILSHLELSVDERLERNLRT